MQESVDSSNRFTGNREELAVSSMLASKPGALTSGSDAGRREGRPVRGSPLDRLASKVIRQETEPRTFSHSLSHYPKSLIKPSGNQRILRCPSQFDLLERISTRCGARDDSEFAYRFNPTREGDSNRNAQENLIKSNLARTVRNLWVAEGRAVNGWFKQDE